MAIEHHRFKHPEPTARFLGGSLSEKQKSVLAFYAADKTTKEIAVELGISQKTVEYHKSEFKIKLGSKGLVGFAMDAIRLGLVDCPCACHRKE